MYDVAQHYIYSTYKVNYVHTFVQECRTCAQNGFQMTHKRKLQLLSALGPLEFKAIDILGLIPRTTIGSQHVVLIANRYFKMPEISPQPKSTRDKF